MQKILTLVNGVPKLVEEIFGAYYQEVESVVSQQTSSTTFSTLLTINTPTVTAGKYAIAFDSLYSFSVTNQKTIFRLQVDGVTVWQSLETPPSSSTSEKIPRSGFKRVDLTAATHAITLDFAVDGGSPVFDVKECRMEFWRVE